MVPDKFNMVDMEGIDLLEVQGISVEGLYDKLVESITLCRYQCLYNWKFNGILIPPTYVEMEVGENEEVIVNFGMSVTPDDIIHLQTIEPEPQEPVIISLFAEENMVYNVPTGVDGFNPVTVDVPSYTPVIESKSITENGTYNPPSGVDGYAPVIVNVPGASGPTYYESTSEPSSSIGNVNDLWVKYTHIGEYLHSLGNNVVYFNTGINEDNVYAAEFSFIPIASAENWQIYFSGTNDGFTFGQNSNNVDGAFLRIRGTQKFISSGILSVGSLNLLVIKDGSIKVNDDVLSTYDDSLSLGSSGRNVWILSSPNSQRKCNVGIIELKLYGANNNLIFHGVADEQNGQPCIYDYISQSYISPEGSGTLEIVQQETNIFDRIYKKAISGWTDWFLS